MINNVLLKILLNINIIISVVVLVRAFCSTIKSKNYKNCKKLFHLQICLLAFIAISILFLKDNIIDFNIGEILGWKLLYLPVYIVPGIIFVLINVFVLRLFMKHKKYNSNKNITFKVYYYLLLGVTIIIFIGLFLNWIINYTIEKQSSVAYYKNKYGIEANIVGHETIFSDDNLIGPNSKNGTIFKLENGDKIFCSTYGKHYDTRQSNEIINFVKEYYEDKFSEVINEFKAENELSRYDKDTTLSGTEYNLINIYSLNVNANEWYNYKYYDEDEFYFNNYYNIDDNNREQTIKNILCLEEVRVSYNNIRILCDKNGNWGKIMDRYIPFFELSGLDFDLYDINYVKENGEQSYKLTIIDNRFARYQEIDGKYVLKK